jgi:uncharacterized protein YecE (DUF72 family)
MRIGCAGWSISSQHAHLFGDGDSHLARYATRFDAVEINSSFYGSHSAKTYAHWASSAPRGFRFSVKLPKAITHDMRLQGAGNALSKFAEEVTALGSRLGGVLVQLPPSLSFDARVAGTFFRCCVAALHQPRHVSRGMSAGSSRGSMRFGSGMTLHASRLIRPVLLLRRNRA